MQFWNEKIQEDVDSIHDLGRLRTNNIYSAFQINVFLHPLTYIIEKIRRDRPNFVLKKIWWYFIDLNNDHDKRDTKLGMYMYPLIV